MGDTSKYLAKLRKNRKNTKDGKTRRKQSMFFKSRRNILTDANGQETADDHEVHEWGRSDTIDLNELKD